MEEFHSSSPDMIDAVVFPSKSHPTFFLNHKACGHVLWEGEPYPQPVRMNQS